MPTVLCDLCRSGSTPRGSDTTSSLRVVDDVEFLSFLETKVIFGASLVLIQSYKECDSTTCMYVHRNTRRTETEKLSDTVLTRRDAIFSNLKLK